MSNYGAGTSMKENREQSEMLAEPHCILCSSHVGTYNPTVPPQMPQYTTKLSGSEMYRLSDRRGQRNSLDVCGRGCCVVSATNSYGR
jgi:hypothetical protein